MVITYIRLHIGELGIGKSTDQSACLTRTAVVFLKKGVWFNFGANFYLATGSSRARYKSTPARP
jgi:hypothetical protein